MWAVCVYLVANFKLEQLASSRGLKSGLGYWLGSGSVLVHSGGLATVVCMKAK